MNVSYLLIGFFLSVVEFRPVLETVNLIGPQLCQISPGEGASTIEGLVMRDNRRFDAIAEQIQRKAERLHLSKQVISLLYMLKTNDNRNMKIIIVETKDCVISEVQHELFRLTLCFVLL